MDNAQETRPTRILTWWRERPFRVRLVQLSPIAIFVLNALAGILVPYAQQMEARNQTQREYEACLREKGNSSICPPHGGTTSQLWDFVLGEYRRQLLMTFMGLYLFLPILYPLGWLPWQPTLWLLAIGWTFVGTRLGQGLPLRQLALYVGFGVIQLSGFAAPLWSTVGD